MSATTELPAGWVPGRAAGSVARRSRPRWVRWVGWLLRRPSLVLAVALVVGVGVVEGPAVAAVGVVAAVVGLSVWARLDPASFDPSAGRALRSAWRSAWTYGLRWRASMVFAGLGAASTATSGCPGSCGSGPVATPTGSGCGWWSAKQPADWERRSDSLAHAFGARSCQVTLVPGRPGYVDPEASAARTGSSRSSSPRPLPAQLDLDAVPVGVTEDGEPWCLAGVRRGAHPHRRGHRVGQGRRCCTSLLRGLAPGIRDGLVDVRAVDPKGGMELTPGDGLFTAVRLTGPTTWSNCSNEAAWTMAQRAARLRGMVRVHTPTVEEPAIVVVVDELALLTSYEPDPQLRKRAIAALSLLLVPGPGAGGHGHRGHAGPPQGHGRAFRDLFPVRVALRMVEADQTDLVLGKGARNRGAACELIPRCPARCRLPAARRRAAPDPGPGLVDQRRRHRRPRP